MCLPFMFALFAIAVAALLASAMTGRLPANRLALSLAIVLLVIGSPAFACAGVTVVAPVVAPVFAPVYAAPLVTQAVVAAPVVATQAVVSGYSAAVVAPQAVVVNPPVQNIVVKNNVRRGLLRRGNRVNIRVR